MLGSEKKRQTEREQRAASKGAARRPVSREPRQTKQSNAPLAPQTKTARPLSPKRTVRQKTTDDRALSSSSVRSCMSGGSSATSAAGKKRLQPVFEWNTVFQFMESELQASLAEKIWNQFGRTKNFDMPEDGDWGDFFFGTFNSPYEAVLAQDLHIRSRP